ncbi:MAG: hypothetical protein R2850_03950 [Bacteroidia bacterium]
MWRVRAPDSTQFDSPTSIVFTNNKIYIVGIRNYIDIPGEFYVFDGLLMILNEDGSFVDFKTIHIEESDLVLYSILQVENDNLFICGNLVNNSANNTAYLAKINMSGDILWDTSYSGFYATCAISKFDEDHIILSGIQWDGLHQNFLE